MSVNEYDRLRITPNNLLDGRVYEEVWLALYPDELREGDVINVGTGVYQVGRVVDYWDDPHKALIDGKASYVRHIGVVHTLVGPIMGGLIRWHLERVSVQARKRVQS